VLFYIVCFRVERSFSVDIVRRCPFFGWVLGGLISTSRVVVNVVEQRTACSSLTFVVYIFL
jgi:hypothetical protein